MDDDSMANWKAELEAKALHRITELEAKVADLSERLARLTPASWCINDDKDCLALQIDLGNDYSVTLSILDGAPPSTDLWRGSGYHSFAHDDRVSFRGWLDEVAFAGD